MATFFGKRMYGSETVHMDKQTLTVRMERFVSETGANDIPLRIASGMALARSMVGKALEQLQIGLGKDQVIKISNKSAQNRDNKTVHDLGLVKNVQTGDRREWGHIEVGYETFRREAWLPRVLIHEAAHKSCDANDGPGTGGYWTKDFADDLDPAAMRTAACLRNADSHALFVWAMCHGQLKDVPAVPGRFEERLAAGVGIAA